MRVFRTSYKDSQGRTREAAKWYVEFRDHLETIRRLPAFTSKAAAEELGRNIDKLVSYHKSSGGQTDPALADWLTALPVRLQEKLVEIGLLAPERVSVSKALSDHLQDFAKELRSRAKIN